MECKNLNAIARELLTYSAQVKEEEVQALVRACAQAKRIFVGGAGRSGFAARAFSNRLMHLGRTVYFVGEPTTPSIQAGDLLVLGSGSGTTASLVSNAKKAKAQGAVLATLTIARRDAEKGSGRSGFRPFDSADGNDVRAAELADLRQRDPLAHGHPRRDTGDDVPASRESGVSRAH